MEGIRKIAVFFDSFSQGGGAEKLLLELANILGADVYTSGYNEKLYIEWKRKAKVTDIGNFFSRFSGRIGFVESALRFAFFKPKKEYGLYIFSGFFSIFAALRCKPNIWYCCQPNRTIYDLREFQKNKAGFIGWLLVEIYSFFWKPLDQWIVKNRVQRIVSISETVRCRVKKYYCLDSAVVFPPIEKGKQAVKFGDFFFFAGRLIPEKRVGLLLEAFSEIPEKKLVIAGSGPLGKKVRDFSGRFGNISFAGRVSESEKSSLLSECLATVYLPVQEDFGMFPLEGNSFGKACIAAKEGGCTETVIDGETGFLIKPEKEILKQRVRGFTAKQAGRMEKNCRENAERFGKELFSESWERIISSCNKESLEKKGAR